MPVGYARSRVALAEELPDKRQQSAEECAGVEAGDDGEVEAALVAFDADVAGKPAEPGEPYLQMQPHRAACVHLQAPTDSAVNVAAFYASKIARPLASRIMTTTRSARTGRVSLLCPP